MLRVIVDTNVLAKTMISKKALRLILVQRWSELLFDLVTSEAIISEIEWVLSEPRI